MPRPAPLPEALQSRAAFTVADALALEVGAPRLRRQGLLRPYHGVRSRTAPETFEERCATYLPRLRAGQVFSHATAAGLLEEALGYPVTGDQETWAALGGTVGVMQLVALGDHLVRRGTEEPAGVLADLDRTTHAVRRIGIAYLERAHAMIRPGVRSAMESIVRVVLVLAGLPEPLVDVEIFGRDGRFIGEGDMVYPKQRQVLEYEGDHHRTDDEQWAKDIRRREEFEDEGWSVMRITKDDVFRHRAEMIRRIARRLGL